MAGPRHISVNEASKPVLPRHAKLKFDETRQGEATPACSPR
jgi:pyrroloquinoline quinone biosynthesis protein D